MTAAFHLNNRKPKSELKVYNSNRLLSFFKTLFFLGVNWTITHVSSRSGGIGQKTIFTGHTAKAVCRLRMGCWCQNIAHSFFVSGLLNSRVLCTRAHTSHIDSVLNDALRIVTRCGGSTPTNHLPILLSIQPAELRRLGPTFSLAYRGYLDLDHLLHDLLSKCC